MSQQISDLVINLDVDSASFAEQIPRIKKMLTGMADTSDESSQRMTQFAERQKKVMQQLESAGGQAAVAMQEKHSSATTAMQSDWQKTSQAVQEAHSRVEALSQQLAKSQANARQQDEMTASFFQQIDAINRLSGETKSLTAIQSQLRQARSQGNISQQDYLALLTRSTERQRELRVEEAKAALEASKTELARNRAIQTLAAQAATFKSSKSDAMEYQAAMKGISAEAAPFIARVREMEFAIANEAAQNKLAAQAIREKAAAEKQAAAEAKRTESARVQFIQNLKSQVATQNLSRTELLRYQAAQLGVGSAADVYINKLEAVKKTTHGLGIESKSARQEMGILVSEVLRGNFGALKGSSITLANRAGWIDQLFSLRGLGIASIVGGIAGSIYGLSKAWYQGTQESIEFNKQLILTGNYAGKTAGQLQEMARSLSVKGVTQGDASKIIGQVVGSGSFNGSRISTVAKAAAEMQESVGTSVDETIKQFQKLYESPTKASAELNSQLHFLTASQFEYISSLERRGLKEEAGEEAAQRYSKAMEARNKALHENLGTIESAWNDIGFAARSAWDKMLDVGRGESLQDKLEAAKKATEQQANGLGNGQWNIYRVNNASGNGAQDQVNFLQKILNLQNDITVSLAEQQKADDNAISAQQKVNSLLDLSASNAKKRKKAQDELTQAIKDGAKLTAEQEKQLRDDINNKYKDPKTPKTKGYVTPAGDKAEDAAARDLLALQSQLTVLQKHKDINDTISKQRQDLWTAEAQFTVLEKASRSRQLSQQEKSLLSSKEQVLQLAQQKALLGDQIVAQEQLNKRMDAAQKYTTQMAEKQAALKASSIMSDRMAGRESVYAQLRSGWQNSGGSLDNSGYKKQLEAAKNYFAEEDKLRGDWKAGAQKSWADYSDTATNSFEQMKSAGTAALNGFSSQLASVLTTGKSSFKDFTKSILSMLTEILIKMQLVNGVNSLSKAFGWNLQANANGGVYNSASLSAFSGSIVDKPTFFAFANGGGVMGEAGPEAILPLKRGANGKLGVVAGNAGGGNPVFHNTIILQSDGTATSKTSGGNDAMSQAMMKMLDKFCQESIIKALRPGGLIFNATRSR